MNIIKSDRFNIELEDILNYISIDSVNRAIEFYDELVAKIKKIPYNPYSYRKRSNDNHVRELIFKGYTIPFYIDTTNETIVLLGIFNQNIWK
jgi:plasmid stabilization system protein ParE